VIIVDTGVLVALVDSDDDHHLECAAWFTGADRRNLVVPAPVIAEACHLIGHHCGPSVEATFLDDLGRGKYGTVSAVLSIDLTRMSQLVAKYADLPLGGTDACVIATAERLHAIEIATIDHRHFRVVRPAHVKAFMLLP
jgi:predicted nucleic acid-binding protein